MVLKELENWGSLTLYLLQKYPLCALPLQPEVREQMTSGYPPVTQVEVI